jgi:hypothetical protein
MSKWVTGVNDKVATWTVTWPLWHISGEHVDPAEKESHCAIPLIWLRHERSAALPSGCIRVSVNNVEVKTNAGVVAELDEGANK